jgi:lipopolysaccharide transport protein LptA
MIALAIVLAAAASPQAKGPVDFTAQTMRMEPRDRRAVLDGAVRLSRDGMVVTGEHAVVEFAPDARQPARRARRRADDEALLGQKLHRFTVDGNVHVQRGRRTADGAHGVLDAEAQTLVLTGNDDADPVLRDGSETLTGERIVMRLDTEDVDVQKPRLVLRRSVPEAEESEHVATRVEAAHLALDRSERLARFSEDVVVRRGDVVVRGPRMDAHYDSSGQVTRLLLRGGVELRQGERRAVSQNADYDARAREVVLTGDPRLFDRGDVLVGEKIALALDSHEVRVERAHGRLRPEAQKDEARVGGKR